MPHTLAWLRTVLVHEPTTDGTSWRVATLAVALRNLSSAIHALEVCLAREQISVGPEELSACAFDRLSRFFGAYCLALNPPSHGEVHLDEEELVNAAEALVMQPLGPGCLRELGMAYSGGRWDVDYLRLEFYLTSHVDCLLAVLKALEPGFGEIIARHSQAGAGK